MVQNLRDRIKGRYSLDDAYHPDTEELLVGAAEYITNKVAAQIDEAEIEMVTIRSVLTCESRHGVCAECYGKTWRQAAEPMGDATGIIAAQ